MEITSTLAFKEVKMLERRFVISTLVAIMAVTPLLAQETRGSLVGRVTDPTGAVVPGVRLDVVHTQTGVATKTISNLHMGAGRRRRACRSGWGNAAASNDHGLHGAGSGSSPDRRTALAARQPHGCPRTDTGVGAGAHFQPGAVGRTCVRQRLDHLVPDRRFRLE